MSAEATNQQGAKITVYWLNKSRAHRVVWLLEELKLEYDVKVFKRNKNMRAPPELKEVHPLGKSPVVGVKVPGVEKEIILAESATVIDYLCEHFGKHLVPSRYPAGKEGILGAETEEWMRYRIADGGCRYSNQLLSNLRKAPVPFFIKPLTGSIANKIDEGFTNPELKVNFDFLENYLAESPSSGEYFCGTEFTAADVMVHFVLEAAVARVPLTEQTYPKLHSYVYRLQKRDAYKRAGERVSKLSGEEFVPMSEVKY